MKNLRSFILGLALVYVPGCLSENGDKQCFSQTLNPSYPCCIGKKVITIDKNGYWGVENGQWCGIELQCFSEALTPSYPCCTGNEVVFTDENGQWGIENDKWCGIGDGACFSTVLGYSCCNSCTVKYTDKYGEWGVENGKWCGISANCTATNSVQETPIQETPVQETPIQETPAQETQVQTIDTDFEFEFLKMYNNEENMLYSPLSIMYALKMTQEGAIGNTFEEIIEAIGNTELPKYTNVDGVLSLANGLFVNETYYENVKTKYIETLKEKYDAEVIKDAFENAQNINKWIEDKTLGIIKDIIDDSMVGREEVATILINALAIDMQWAVKFELIDTDEGYFFMDNGEEKSVAMMSMKRIKSQNISYIKDSDLTVLAMNLKEYEGTQLEFMAIMPKQNLKGYIENLTKETIKELDQRLSLSSDLQDGINIHIPKFKFSHEINLKSSLMNLGIRDAFDKYHADFSNMTNSKENGYLFFISDALHKADIDFSETGIKAAAISIEFFMEITSMYWPLNITINRPFMFIIRDKNTKDIWFTGTVYEPTPWEENEAYYS